MNQGEAKEIVQRLNYGIVFKPEVDMFMAQEEWLHTFQIPIPRSLGSPNVGSCHRDNETCFLINQAFLQVMVIRTETALRINNTVNNIRKLIPETKIHKSRSARSLLPFIGTLSKSIFGLADEKDIEILAKHINALTRRTEGLSEILSQHGTHFSSYIKASNKRMDNLMAGIHENEMAIDYIQSKVETVASNLKEMFLRMNTRLITHLEHANRLNNEIEEMKLGLLDLVNGKLSPLLIQPEVIAATLHDIQRLLNQKYQGFHLISKTVQEIYTSAKFLYTRNNSNIYVTVKFPVSYQQHPLTVYRIISMPVPINETSEHGTHLLNLPKFLIISHDNEYYATLSQEEFSACTGRNPTYCTLNKALTPATTPSCEYGLFANNKVTVNSYCDFRFVHNQITPKVIEINPSTILLYRTPVLSLECGNEQRMVSGCDYCIMKFPCMCSVTTSQFFLQPRLTACQNETKNVTKLHPLNLALLQQFFDSSVIKHIYADTAFLRPINISTPVFKIYKHKMNNMLADDIKTHLSLKRMADKAKNDETIFKTLSEPLLEGELSLNTSWPDINAILIFISTTLTIGSVLAITWMYFRLRKLSMTLLMLQQTQLADTMSTLPSFIYKQVQSTDTSDSQTYFNLTLSWNHAIFLLTTLILILIIAILAKLHRRIKYDAPWLYVEIASQDECLLMPVIRLPLCPAECKFQLPSTIGSLLVIGNKFAPQMNISWPNFAVTNKQNGQNMLVPETFDLSFIHAYKLKKMLNKPFFVHMYVAHSGFLKQID